MRILLVMPLAQQTGGGELMLLQLLEYGRNQGVNWLVVFLQNGPMVQQARDLGVAVWVIPSGRIREFHRFPGTWRRIAQLARQEKADVIFGWMATSQLWASPVAILAGLPTLWYQLGIPERHILDQLATFLPNQGILTCSQAGATAQARLWPPRPLRVVYPGVELGRFDPGKLPAPKVLRESLGLPPLGPVIGIVGRLQRWKGIHVLIGAMPAILKRYPQAHCVVVGGKHDLEPDYSLFLQQQIESLNLQAQISLAGLQRNIPEWMQAMDIVVHASEQEPFGIVVIEAMALGKPVVAGNQGGPTEIFTPATEGLLAPYGDESALAQTILRYLDEPDLATACGQKARARAQEFSTQAYARNWIQAVSSLLETS